MCHRRNKRGRKAILLPTLSPHLSAWNFIFIYLVVLDAFSYHVNYIGNHSLPSTSRFVWLGRRYLIKMFGWERTVGLKSQGRRIIEQVHFGLSPNNASRKTLCTRKSNERTCRDVAEPSWSHCRSSQRILYNLLHYIIYYIVKNKWLTGYLSTATSVAYLIYTSPGAKKAAPVLSMGWPFHIECAPLSAGVLMLE